MTPEDICQGRTVSLLPLMRYVYTLAFEEEPDYNLIREQFDVIEALAPGGDFDWKKLVPVAKELKPEELEHGFLIKGSSNRNKNSTPKLKDKPSSGHMPSKQAIADDLGEDQNSPRIAEEKGESKVLPKISYRMQQNFIKHVCSGQKF